MMKWDVTYSYLARTPTAIITKDEGRTEDGRYADLEEQVKRNVPERYKLEFDYFTDQVDIWSVRASGKRDRFMILMAA